MEAIGTYSNKASLRKRYTDLRKRVQEVASATTPVTPRWPAAPHETVPQRRRHRRHPAELRVRRHDRTDRKPLQHLQTRVATVLREQGIAIRRQGLTQEQVSEAAGLYAKGRSLAWLGARYNVSRTTVAAALRHWHRPCAKGVGRCPTQGRFDYCHAQRARSRISLRCGWAQHGFRFSSSSTGTALPRAEQQRRCKGH